MIQLNIMEENDRQPATIHRKGGTCMTGFKLVVIFGLALVLVTAGLAGAVQRTVLVELFTSNA